MNLQNYKEHPANTGLDYSFEGAISQEVLRRYLSRAINHFYFESLDRDVLALNKRFILNTGAKFVGRACTMWSMGGGDEGLIAGYGRALGDIHSADPDIIFEACIFETTFKSITQIPIPAVVFEAFGLKSEARCFDYDAMVFEDGLFLNHWGEEASVPDMTRLETQLWFFYRAMLFIDAGFECLHMGQVHLIGAHDAGFECWTKVMNMIRRYAREKARRRFVLINAHTHGLIGSDGLLLFDFHRFPIRAKAPEDECDHIPSEDNPQRVVLSTGYLDSLFGKSLGGATHSGWTCEMLPYLVELDNYGGYFPEWLDKSDQPWWGFDEISWFANQPLHYQKYWLDYAYKWIKDIDNGQGALEMPGTRTAAIRSGEDLMTIRQLDFYPYDRKFSEKGSDIEQAIRDIWVRDNAAV
ncbi:MAG: hypothetical protein AB9835_05990 [Eubacteriales bacterium]